MITDLFLNVIGISISISPVIMLLLIFTPFLQKRYAMKWSYLMWVVIAIRLILPFHPDISFPQIVLDVPARITAPIHTAAKNDTPAMSPTAPAPIAVNQEDAMKAPLQADIEPSRFTWLDMIAYLWLTGCLLFLSVHTGSLLHYRGQIRKKGAVVRETYILQQVRRLSGKLHVRPHIKILRYEDAESPMVIGFLKPVLVLPDCDYSEEELYFILKHELIHIKRHDMYFKLLFMLANALHWFNPLVYIMQKEAVVDMELSCDEKVIRQSAYAVRKAYTEALLSTFGKRHKKGTFFTTQFYGGKKIMKKRFKNILTKSPRKNGAFLCICAICITLLSGMAIGCSAIKSDAPQEPVQTDPDTANPGLEENTNTQAADSDIQTADSSTQATSANDSNMDISGDPQPETMESLPEQPLPSEETTYSSILLGKSNFICADLANESLNINEAGRAVTDDDSVTVSATKFTVIDLDGDGSDEVVCWLQINGLSDYGFLILHDQNGEIYGYTLQYRAFINLKTDGTFLFSGGSADTGTGKLFFSETGYGISEQAYSQSAYDADNELTIQYFINEEPCSEDEFQDAINSQDQKPDVTWYDLSESNINAVLQ